MALVVLPGWGDISKSWEAVATRLRETHQVVLFDLPGFGEKSDLLDRAWAVQDYANWVVAKIERQSLEEVVLVGHSFGGKVAARIAATRPAWLSSLVLVAAAGMPYKKTVQLKIRLISILSKALKWLPFIKNRRAALYLKIGAGDYLQTSGHLRQTFLKIKAESSIDDAKKITNPTLILWGDSDSITPLYMSEQWQSRIQNSELKIIPGATHYLHIERPNAVVEAIRGESR